MEQDLLKRDKSFDGLKYFLIFLVILGHMNTSDFNALWTSKIIYAFHMPVFIFVSGYFSSAEIINVSRLWKWVRKILVIYIIAQLIQNLLFISLGGSVAITKLLFITPQMALWYLISLIFWRLLLIVAGQLGGGYFVCFTFLSLIIVFIVGFVPLTILSFQRTFTFLPFFMIGYLFKKYSLLHKLESVPLLLTIIIFVVGLYTSQFLPVYIPSKPYNDISDMVVLVFQTMLGFLLCLCVVRFSRTGLFDVFSSYGQNTLWIYIGHTFLIVIQKNILRLMGCTLNEIEAIVLSIVYIILLTFFAGRLNVRENISKGIIHIN